MTRGPLAFQGSVRHRADWLSDARATAVGLVLVAPLTVAMVVGSNALILATSGLVLVASLVSPLTGLVALAFIAPFPRPLAVPAPGLYAVIAAAIFVGLLLRLPIDRPRLRWPSAEVWLIGALLAYVAAHFAANLADGPATSMGSAIISSFSQFAAVVLTFVTAGLVLRGRSPYPVLAALLLSAALAAAIAVAQSMDAEALFGGLVVGNELLAPLGVDRVTGPFRDPNYFGAYLATATTLGVGCAVVARTVRLRAVLAALAAFVGVATVLTLSRGALVSVIGGIVVIAFTRGRKTGILVVAALLLAVIVAWPLFAEVRYAAKPDLAAGGLSTQLQSSDNRTEAWLAGLDVFFSSPVLGIGWGRILEETSTGIAAHNWHITVLGETGLAGFVLWVLFVASVALSLRDRRPAARTIGLSVLVAWLLASMFIEVPRTYSATALALIVLAAALSAEWGSRGDERDASSGARSLRSPYAGLRPRRISEGASR